MQEADGNGIDACLAELPHSLPDFLLVKWSKNVTVGYGDALFDDQAVAASDERRATAKATPVGVRSSTASCGGRYG